MRAPSPMVPVSNDASHRLARAAAGVGALETWRVRCPGQIPDRRDKGPVSMAAGLFPACSQAARAALAILEARMTRQRRAVPCQLLERKRPLSAACQTGGDTATAWI